MASLPTVVSIEDDEDIFKLLKATLRPLPIELYHAKTGQEAIDLIPHVNPDVIILDISLPDLQGWDVLRSINKLDVELKGVIVLTARTEAPHRVIAHLQAVTAFLAKPFNPTELRDIIRETLGLA